MTCLFSSIVVTKASYRPESCRRCTVSEQRASDKDRSEFLVRTWCRICPLVLVLCCALYVSGKAGKHAHQDLSTPPVAIWLLLLMLKIELSLREPPFLDPLVLACVVEIMSASGTEPFAACRYPWYWAQLFGQF